MSIFKTLGKILSAPARGIGHALRTSHIPILSGLGGDVEKAGNAFAGKGKFFKNLLPLGKDIGLALATGGLGNAGGALGKLGHLGSSALGHVGGGAGRGLLGGALHKLGQLGPEKLLGIAGAGMNLVGAHQQRRQADRYNNANTDIRNQLMSRVLGGGANQTYNFQPEGQ